MGNIFARQLHIHSAGRLYISSNEIGLDQAQTRPPIVGCTRCAGRRKWLSRHSKGTVRCGDCHVGIDERVASSIDSDMDCRTLPNPRQFLLIHRRSLRALTATKSDGHYLARS